MDNRRMKRGRRRRDGRTSWWRTLAAGLWWLLGTHTAVSLDFDPPRREPEDPQLERHRELRDRMMWP